MNSMAVASFWRCYRKLAAEIRKAAVDAHRLFLQNPLHPGLHFHRLATNPLLWSVRVTLDYRAVGIKQGNTITWVWIGDHKTFDQIF